MHFAKNHPLDQIGLAWQLSEFHGWGVFGLNLALSLKNNGYPYAKFLHKPNIDPLKYPQLQDSFKDWAENEASYLNAQETINHPNLTVIHSLGNDFAPTDRKHWGRKNIGFIFFENTTFSVQGLERARSFDLILAGSRWNAQILSKLGIKKVAYVMQGIDRQRFESVSPQKHPGKFVIFSGGKLEYRKGQDIVLAAFKEFYKRHPDSVLLTAWYNPWPQITQDLVNSPFGFGVPRIVDNQVDVAEWCSRSGLPSSAFMHIGLTPNAQMPQIYANADVALFPNRAEGGTNLVAMEAMATGVPCILSANTGHLDLIAENNCIPLSQQKQYSISSHMGWGESDVNEIVNSLELAYSNRERLNQIGINGKNFINQFSWHEQTRKLVELCGAIY